MIKITTQEIFASGIGMCLGAFLTYTLLPQEALIHNDLAIHSEDEDYHIHTDFLIQVEGETLELGTAELTTTSEQSLHSDAHLHNENGDVLHMHTENVPFIEFLESIKVTLPDGCLAVKNITYCPSTDKVLRLYVNGVQFEDDIAEYIPADLDRVLMYYGVADNPELNTYLEAIPDEACIYSGSCPERGIAPAEECGLTCEL